MAAAQQTPIYYQHLSKKDGLSDYLVSSVTKDSLGFLWLSTPSGLNRFDGYSFTVFNDLPANEHQISGQTIQEIGLTTKQELAIIYKDNQDYFDLLSPVDFSVRKIQLYPANGVKGSVRKIKIDPSGFVYVASIDKDAVNIYQYEKGDTLQQIAQIPCPGILLSTALVDLTRIDGQQMLVNINTHGLFHLQNSNVLRRITPPDHEAAFETRFLRPLLDGNILISIRRTSNVYTYFPKTGEMKRLQQLPAEGEYTYAWPDKQGNILLIRTSGAGNYPIARQLFLLDKENQISPFDFLLDVSPYIVSVYSEDFYKTIFLGVDTGLKIFRNNRNKVQTYLVENVGSGEFGSVMRGMDSRNDSLIYLARENTYWYQLNRHTGKVDTLRITDPYNQNPISFKCSFRLLQQEEQLWGIACQGSGTGLLINYDLQNRQSDIFYYNGRFYDLLKSYDGYFWLIAKDEVEDYQLVRFNPDSKTFEEYRTPEGDNPFKNVLLRAIYETQDGRIWVASNKGLYVMNNARTRITNFNTTEGLPSNLIQCLYQGQDQRLWVGSTGGLSVFDTQKDSLLRTYSRKEGLSNNAVTSILEASADSLWIGTEDGLTFIDLSATPVATRTFYNSNGFSSSSFTRFSAFKTADNQFFMGTTNGLNVFYPDTLLKQENISPPRLISISTYNRNKDTYQEFCQPMCPDKHITLGPYDEQLKLSFMLDSYYNINKNKFRVKLGGVDQRWKTLDGQNTIDYNLIPPGRHQLQVQSAGPDGKWSTENLYLGIHKKQLFYKTLWFFALCILLLGLFIYGIIRYRLEQRLKEEQFRTKLSSDIHDEVSGLLAGIAMQSDVLQLTATDETQTRQLQKIAAVSRKAMSKLSDVIWSIDSRKDRMQDLITRIQEHAEDVLLPLDIRYTIVKKNIDLESKIPVNIRQDVYLIYKEAINNVAKHSNATQVSILFARTAEGLKLEVSDNGSTTKSKSAITGQGLSNMEMRAKRIDSQLHISRENGFQVSLITKKV